MRRLLLSLVLLTACGRATVRERDRADVVVDGVSFDAGSVTVLVHYATCSSQSVRISVAGTETTRNCVRALTEGSTVTLVEREMKFKLVTCGATPEVVHSLGPCAVPRDMMRFERSGQPCER